MSYITHNDLAFQPHHHMGPMKAKNDMNWVETYLDSGINSGSTSRGPESIILSHEEWDSKDNNTRAHRIKQAMFGDENRVLTDLSGHNVVSKLSQPSQLLKNAVVNLVQYQDDTDLAEKALPELVRLLEDDDIVVVTQAAAMISRLARREASKSVVSRNKLVIEGLVQAFTKSECATSDISRHTAILLHSASTFSDGCNVIENNRLCICALVRLLSHNLQSVISYAVTCLHNILIHHSKNEIVNLKTTLIKVGAVSCLTKLLQKKEDKLLAVVNDCLQILVFKNNEAKLLMITDNGPSNLLRIIQSTDYEKLQWTTSRLLQVVSVCREIKKNLLDCDVIAVICSVLHKSNISERVSHHCMFTIRNISDQAAYRNENAEVLIRMLIEYLTSSDLVLASCSAGILSNLTCNNQTNKQVVVQHNGVEALVRTLIQTANLETVESTICALRHLTCRHKLATAAQESIRLCFGLPAIVRLLNTSDNAWALLKATAGLISNLAINPLNSTVLRENGVINRMISVVKSSYKIMMANNELSRKRVADSTTEAVSGTTATASCIEVVLETCFNALYSLCRDNLNRKAICDQSNSFFGIIREMIINDRTSLGAVKSILTLSNELVKVPSGATQINKFKNQLSVLCTNNDPNIASLATLICQKLNTIPNGGTS